MTDIVDRLVRFNHKIGFDRRVCLSTDLEVEAAIEIDRLREEVEKYKAIVSKAIREQIDVRKDERERCAKIAQFHWEKIDAHPESLAAREGRIIASAIRDGNDD